MSSLTAEVVDGIEKVNTNQWDNVVSQSAGGTIFHQSGWLRTIENSLDRTPRHIVVRKGNNPIAVCPNFLLEIDVPFDSPFDLRSVGLTELSSLRPGFGGPLVVAEKDKSIELIFRAVSRICDGGPIVHRMRILDPTHVQYAQTFSSRGYVPSLLYCRFVIQLDDYQRIWDGLEKERRKEIREAKEHDPVIEQEEITGRTIRKFYADYEKAIERLDGTSYPLSFFEALVDHLKDDFTIFTTYVADEPAGSHLYFQDDRQDSLHYFFSSVREEHFKYSSPSVLHDYAIQWAIENGYSTYDFGGTSSHYGDGTFNYKKKFGAQLEPVYEWEKDTSSIVWRLYNFARRQYIDRIS